MTGRVGWGCRQVEDGIFSAYSQQTTRGREVRKIHRGMFIFWEHDKKVLYCGRQQKRSISQWGPLTMPCGCVGMCVCVSERENDREKKLIGCKLYVCFLPSVLSSGVIKCPQIPHPVTACAVGNYMLWRHHFTSLGRLLSFCLATSHSDQSTLSIYVAEQLLLFESLTDASLILDHEVPRCRADNLCDLFFISNLLHCPFSRYLRAAHGLVPGLYLFWTYFCRVTLITAGTGGILASWYPATVIVHIMHYTYPANEAIH